MRKTAKRITRPRKNPLFGGLFGGKKKRISSKDGATISVDDGTIILSGKGSTDIYRDFVKILEIDEKTVKIEFSPNSDPKKKYALNRPENPVETPMRWGLEERVARRRPRE